MLYNKFRLYRDTLGDELVPKLSLCERAVSQHWFGGSLRSLGHAIRIPSLVRIVRHIGIFG
jgi:hypothetical protein